MEGLENKYLEFTAVGFCFLAALPWVKEIRKNGLWEENVAILDWEKTVGCRAVGDCPRYGILLEHAGKRLGVAAEKVTGVREVAPDCMMELKGPVKNEKNRFISAAVSRKEHGEGLAFVLCMEILADLAVINSE